MKNTFVWTYIVATSDFPYPVPCPFPNVSKHVIIKNNCFLLLSDIPGNLCDERYKFSYENVPSMIFKNGNFKFEQQIWKDGVVIYGWEVAFAVIVV